MKKLILVLFVCFSCSVDNLVAQTNKKPLVKKQKSAQTQATDDYTKQLYDTTSTQTKAHYKTGSNELYKLITERMKYSDADIQKRASGNAIISFDVLPDSTVSNITLLQNPCIDCGRNLVEIFQNLRFVPSVMQGTPMKSNIVMEVPVLAH